MKLPALILLGTGLALAAGPTLACGSGKLHMETAQVAVYGIDFASVTATQPGLAGCTVDTLQLRSQGHAVPMRVLDANGNGRFDAGDRLEWVAERLHGSESWFNPHSLVNVYELSAAPGVHARLQPVPAGDARAAPARLQRSIHREKDRLMMRLKTGQVKPGEEPDLWFWWKMTMIDPAPYRMRFDLPDLRTSRDGRVLTLAFRGQSSVRAPGDKPSPPDHEVVVELNGRNVATLDWDGNDHIVREIPLPAGSLREQGNVLTLHVPRRVPAWSHKGNALVDVVMFDYYALTYPLAGETGAQAAPFTVAGAGRPRLRAAEPLQLYGSDGRLYLPQQAGDGYRYASIAAGTRLFPLAPSQRPLAPQGLRVVRDQVDWRQPEHGYDYVMIAYPTLLDATRPLAEYHRAHGQKVALIDVETVYDEFSHGIVTPRAIRALLKHAHGHWPAPRPRYVLLVGDASFDIRPRRAQMKNYSTWTDRVLLRPGRYNVIPATPYADQPAVAGARNLIPTFQHYAAEGQSASDNGFVDFDPDGIHPAMAIGRFPVVKPEAVSAIVAKTIDYMSHPQMGDWRQRVMFITNDSRAFQSQSNTIAASIGQLGFTPDKIYPQSADKNNLAHQKAIMQGLDQGQLLVHFLGHGGRFIWRTGPPDPRKNHDLFTLDDVDRLKNRDRLPMVLSMTCYSAPFDNPTDDSIGERFLREADGGAVAVFAASWRNSPDPAFSGDLMKALLQPGVRVGDAILQAKNATNNRDMIGMYNLLGDPALVLQRPRENLRMQQLGSGATARVRIAVPGQGSFHGTLRVEWLDADRQVLSTRDYRIDAPRLTLPAPPPQAHEVRVYAFDPARKADALGALVLQPPQPAGPSWWARLFAPAAQAMPLRDAGDRVFGSNFGG
ncbi:MAG TPA: C25 family cysteine peptidase [Rhodanobacteraceae bacterium]|nr:C25 family cysteine peptidase [Rhodanobacteraceae bacterium]